MRVLALLALVALLAGCGRAGPPVRARPAPEQPAAAEQVKKSSPAPSSDVGEGDEEEAP